MKRSIKRGRLLVGAVVSACALMAVSASAASAANAWWVSPGTPSASGTLTLKQNGANEKTCSVSNAGGTAANVESGGTKAGVLNLKNSPAEWLELSCAGSFNLVIRAGGSLTYESGYWLSVPASSNTLGSPYGSYSQAAMKLPWTNAAEGKSSSFSFSNTKIGFNGGGDITATGTITVKKNNGENLLLTH